jgi:hypothetical protein
MANWSVLPADGLLLLPKDGFCEIMGGKMVPGASEAANSR